MTRIHQQTAGCADFDVLLGDEHGPSFRVLLPEWIRARGLQYDGLLHVIPGTWQEKNGGMAGRFTVGGQLDVEVRIETRESDILIDLTVENTGDLDLSDVWANVCTSANHLPGSPNWSNGDLLPAVPLDRAVQGRYWFEVLTPKRLFALTAEGWGPMHPCPDRPDASAVPLYGFTPSLTADACACAVESPAGGVWLFQAWRTSCRWCSPCPGNACMHLEPFLAERVQPGAKGSISGRVGIHRGDRLSLAGGIRSWCAAGRKPGSS